MCNCVLYVCCFKTDGLRCCQCYTRLNLKLKVTDGFIFLFWYLVEYFGPCVICTYNLEMKKWKQRTVFNPNHSKRYKTKRKEHSYPWTHQSWDQVPRCLERENLLCWTNSLDSIALLNIVSCILQLLKFYHWFMYYLYQSLDWFP